ncbi:MAG: mercury methylation corrinoid protein HgcA [Thermodesulfobacteriota bacterium]
MHERAGYAICHYVTDFIETAVGPVPRVATSPTLSDRLQTMAARSGLSRDNYPVTPGLYCVGNPDRDAPVLASANFKLSFDHLRWSLAGEDGWLLVLDTRGINVWCAAGKGTFATEELVRSVRACGLEKLVGHRQLIVPQLGAPGVSGLQVKKECGFKVTFGPIRAADLPKFLAKGADEEMREATFSLGERAVLIPVELYLTIKPFFLALLPLFLLAGAGPGFFSLATALERGPVLIGATLLGIGAGAILVPLLLPLLPGRQFWIKGLITGLGSGGLYWYLLSGGVSLAEGVAILSWCTAIASYLGMNFTGTTPFTSPSGVEYEMRRGIPLQISLAMAAVVCWLLASFLGGRS